MIVPSEFSVYVPLPFTFLTSERSVASLSSLVPSVFFNHSLTTTSLAVPLASVITYTVSSLSEAELVPNALLFIVFSSVCSSSSLVAASCAAPLDATSSAVTAPHAIDVNASIVATISALVRTRYFFIIIIASRLNVCNFCLYFCFSYA